MSKNSIARVLSCSANNWVFCGLGGSQIGFGCSSKPCNFSFICRSSSHSTEMEARKGLLLRTVLEGYSLSNRASNSMSCSRIFSFIKGEKDFLITARNYLLLSISISREGIYLGLYFFILITVKVFVFLLMYRNEWCIVRLQFYCLQNTGPGNDSAKKFSLLVSVLSWVLNNTEKWSKNFIQCILFIFFWIFFQKLFNLKEK